MIRPPNDSRTCYIQHSQTALITPGSQWAPVNPGSQNILLLTSSCSLFLLWPQDPSQAPRTGVMQVLQSKTSIQGPHKTNCYKTRFSTHPSQVSSLNSRPSNQPPHYTGSWGHRFQTRSHGPRLQVHTKAKLAHVTRGSWHVWCLRTQSLELSMQTQAWSPSLMTQILGLWWTQAQECQQ